MAMHQFDDQLQYWRQELNEAGYVVLENVFDPTINGEFEAVSKLVCDINDQDLINYNNTQASTYREMIEDNTFDVGHGAPGDATVYFHNEKGYTNHFPNYIMFGCFNPAAQGGVTKISNSIKFTNDLKNESALLYDRLLKEGVRYLRVLHSRENESKSEYGDIIDEYSRYWQSYFGEQDINIILSKFESVKYENVVFNSDSGEVTHMTHRDVVHGDVLVHSVLDMHGRYFDFLEKYSGMEYNRRPFHCTWGHGSEFTKEELLLMDDIYRNNEIAIEMKKGDMIVLNNLLYTHSRTRFVNGSGNGEMRKIGALMAKQCKRLCY